MYNSVIPATGAAASGLAFTGSNSLWMGLAAFAFVAVGTAMLRIVPKRNTSR